MTDPNVDAAVRQHQFAATASLESFKSVISSASGALRLLSIVNAGGAIALLGFIGAVAGKDKQIFQTSEIFLLPITCFATGLILAVVVSCGMYLAQLVFSVSAKHKRFDYVNPYVHDTADSTRYLKVGKRLQKVNIAVATCSFLFFVAGLWFCRTLILAAKL